MLDALYTRRSIRKYKPDPVSEEDLKTVLRAAMYAPSAHNLKPWHFIVCDDRSVIEKFMSFHRYSGMMKEAPVCIFVVADVSKETHPGFYMQDCAAATQNLLLEAHALGLGACWMGICPVKEMMDETSKLFGLPENILPFCAIALGHPNENPTAHERYKEAKIHRNAW